MALQWDIAAVKNAKTAEMVRPQLLGTPRLLLGTPRWLAPAGLHRLAPVRCSSAGGGPAVPSWVVPSCVVRGAGPKRDPFGCPTREVGHTRWGPPQAVSGARPPRPPNPSRPLGASPPQCLCPLPVGCACSNVSSQSCPLTSWCLCVLVSACLCVRVCTADGSSPLTVLVWTGRSATVRATVAGPRPTNSSPPRPCRSVHTMGEHAALPKPRTTMQHRAFDTRGTGRER